MQIHEATILLVEDDPDLLGFYERWFKREGATTLTAENGSQALQILDTHTVHLIISDVRMPVMDGIELARRLKQRRAARPTIVSVSGYCDVQLRELSDIGIERTLHKPVSRRMLVAAAQACLCTKRERWSTAPPVVTDQLLDVRLGSLAEALNDGHIAFGNGGFCIGATGTYREGESTRLHIVFGEDRRTISGGGLVQWTDHGNPEIGVEILYLQEDCIDWVLGAIEDGQPATFIPATARSAAMPR